MKFFRFNLPPLNLNHNHNHININNNNNNNGGGFSQAQGQGQGQHRDQGQVLDLSTSSTSGLPLLGRLDKVRLEVTFENAAPGLPVGDHGHTPSHSTHPLLYSPTFSPFCNPEGKPFSCHKHSHISLPPPLTPISPPLTPTNTPSHYHPTPLTINTPQHRSPWAPMTPCSQARQGLARNGHKK